MEEERRHTRDEFMERVFKLESAVQRLTEHEKLDKPRYEEWHEETVGRLVELEKLHLDTANGRLRDLESRPIIVQLTQKELKELFLEWTEALHGRLFYRVFSSVLGAVGLIVAALVTAYFNLK